MGVRCASNELEYITEQDNRSNSRHMGQVLMKGKLRPPGWRKYVMQDRKGLTEVGLFEQVLEVE